MVKWVCAWMTRFALKVLDPTRMRWKDDQVRMSNLKAIAQECNCVSLCTCYVMTLTLRPMSNKSSRGPVQLVDRKKWPLQWQCDKSPPGSSGLKRDSRCGDLMGRKAQWAPATMHTYQQMYTSLHIETRKVFATWRAQASSRHSSECLTNELNLSHAAFSLR